MATVLYIYIVGSSDVRILASGGIFFRCLTPKDAVYKDYKAKPLIRRSVHLRILQYIYIYIYRERERERERERGGLLFIFKILI